jgi:tetraacyldisaccharide 4'-kinase
LSCKVISVGNITLGGTGKTSLVEYIARYLRQEGHKVAILSRGYKRRKTQDPRYMAQDARRTTHYGLAIPDYEAMGDEPYMLSKKLADIPVIVDADRIRAANLAIRKHHIDTAVLDDGFQQWKIKKDLEVVCIDGMNPFGNRRLLPRGILREPLSSLKRADLFVLTKTNLNSDTQAAKSFLRSVNPKAPIFESVHKPLGFCSIDKPDELLKIEDLRGKTMALFCGIGDPDSFEDLVKGIGINVGLFLKFPDHHNYTRRDLDSIIKSSQEKNIGTIITTEKDAVRLPQLPITNYQLPILILRIELQIAQDEDEFHNRLLRVYSL